MSMLRIDATKMFCFPTPSFYPVMPLVAIVDWQVKQYYKSMESAKKANIRDLHALHRAAH